MAEVLQFKDFSVGADNILDIGAVPGGAGDPERPGVVSEIGVAFGYEGDDLGKLIGKVAPSKKLQENIDHAASTLADPAVRKKIGYEDETGIEVARAWGNRSGLQDEVFRPLMQPSGEIPKEFAAVVVTDGVVNWMNRMAEVARQTADGRKIPLALLVSGGRAIGDGEHPDLVGGTPSMDYMSGTLAPRLADSFDRVEVIETGSEEGQTVMQRGVEYLADEEGIDLEQARLIIASVAGNWMQKGSQLRAAAKEIRTGFDEHPGHRQLWVSSDSFPLGETGEEPKATYQNPYSAIGNILRGAKLLDEQN